MDSIIYQHLNYDHAPGFTPVRRPDRQTFADSPALASQAPWTTARCNRLLRPLSSKIASLQKNKHQVAKAIKETETKTLDRCHCERLSSRITEPATCSVRQGNDGDDPDWAPENPPKKLKRTYSNKGSANLGRKAGRPRTKSTRVFGELSITAPLLNVQNQSSQTHAESQEDTAREANLWMNSQDIKNEAQTGKPSTRTYNKNTQASARDSFRRLARSVAPSQWMLYDGLYTGLDALLKATTKTKPPPVTGTRSLFATCLRKVPDYIDLEQAWAEEENEDSKEDLTTTIYNELESQGCSAAGGWKPLKQITRAHGITIIGKAIEESIIHPLLGKGLITLCMDASAFEEAESLCLYLLQGMHQITQPKGATDELFRSAIGLRTLRNIADRTGRWGFFYRTLVTLFENDIIPVEWISSPDMIEPWNMVIASIAQQDGLQSYASKLLQTVISLSYRANKTTRKISSQSPPERIKTLRAPDQTINANDTLSISLNSTISNLMTVIISVTTTKCNRTGNMFRAPVSATNLIQLMGLQAYHYIRNHQPSIQTNQGERAFFPFFAKILCSPNNSPSTFQRTIPKTMDKISEKMIDTLTTFISSSAHCCSLTNLQRSPLSYIQQFVESLTTSSSSSLGHLRKQIQQIAIASAFHFAEKNQVPEYLDWALELEENLERSSSPCQSAEGVGRTPVKRQNKTGLGFRWEEGLGEWVSKTPLVVIKTKGKGSQQSSANTTLLSSPHSSPISQSSRSSLSEQELDSSPVTKLLDYIPASKKRRFDSSVQAVVKRDVETKTRGRARKHIRFSDILSSSEGEEEEEGDEEEVDERDDIPSHCFHTLPTTMASIAVIIPTRLSSISASYHSFHSSSTSDSSDNDNDHDDEESEFEQDKANLPTYSTKRKRGRPPGISKTKSQTITAPRKSIRTVALKNSRTSLRPSLRRGSKRSTDLASTSIRCKSKGKENEEEEEEEESEDELA